MFNRIRRADDSITSIEMERNIFRMLNYASILLEIEISQPNNVRLEGTIDPYNGTDILVLGPKDEVDQFITYCESYTRGKSIRFEKESRMLIGP